LNTAIAHQPQAALLYRQRGRLYRQRQDYGVALGDIDRAILLQPPPRGRRRLAAEARELAEDHVARGQLLNRMDRLDDAVKACDAALALLPDFSKAHRLRAELFLELQRYREAIQAFDAYLEHGPATAEVFEALGLARMKLHDYAGAIDAYTEGLNLKPGRPLRYTLLAHRGWAYLIGGESPRLALPDFEAALQLDPGPAEAYAGRGFARVRLGDYLKGVADADRAVHRAPDDYRIQYQAARIYVQALVRVEADKAVMQERRRRELSQEYEVRALGLLRRVLDLVPAGQRARFWHEQAQKDPALDPVRRRDGFRQLAAVYAARIAK
jgi:tetratricopeptide (TPR) repeat protein